MKIIDLLTAALLPAVCQSCRRPLVRGESLLCLRCRAALHNTHFGFGTPEASELRWRLPRDLPIDTVTAMSAYTPDCDAARLIKRGKYDDAPRLIEELAGELAARLIAEKRMAGIDALVPVPMHLFKRICRGYNQAAIIADVISRRSGVPTVNALRAVRGHSSQTRSSGAAGRAANVSGIFACRHPEAVAGRRLMLVDDIITTGATLSEACRVLASAGAAAIHIATLAATVKG